MLLKNLFPLIFMLLFTACSQQNSESHILVKSKTELDSAIINARPGDEITLANGIWTDVNVELTSSGTKENPIVLRAETPGKVFIEGQSYVKFGGDYITVKDLYFRNGYTPSNAVIEFRLNKKVANHCILTSCVIENFNQPQRDRQDHWVEFWGRHNELSHCNIIGKSNSGPTIRIQLKGNESIKNAHRIVNNHFGPRPRKGGPHGETIQLGDSETSMCPGNTLVANNLFDRCNGEIEVISSKSNFNEFRNNVFYKCEGSLVTRHGNYCIIDGNYFIGDDNSENMGGIRIINTGHWVTNNYFYKLKGSNFRSALAVMNGIPKSPLNRYNQVTDVVVAYNTWVECKSPWQFGVGANLDQKDVLPASEIRSARPIRTILANNIIYETHPLSTPIVAHDDLDGIMFKDNVVNDRTLANESNNALDFCDFNMTGLTTDILVPSKEVSEVETYKGFEFEKITTDIFGNSREKGNQVGAMCNAMYKDPGLLTANKYGSSWFRVEKDNKKPEIHRISVGQQNLVSSIMNASDGDVIMLEDGVYEINSPVKIDKNIVIKPATEQSNVKLVYSGDKNMPLFQMNPFGGLYLENIVIEGNEKNEMIAPLQKNMSALYKLSLKESKISKFNYVVKAYKETFADSVLFDHCEITNCKNGISLAAETDDKGDYNAGFLFVESCVFKNVKSNVINYYRGGYDESTIGGTLKVLNSVFTNCGTEQENKILLNNRGIVNVDISGNTFKNNPVKLVALLWGAKNNTHSNNDIVNSGKIVVQENIKMTLMY